MFTRVALLSIALAGMAAAQSSLVIVNNCAETIDPGFFPAAGADGTTGGFSLASGASQPVPLPAGYNGRMWGRTGCDADGNNCTTGGCSGGLDCTSPAAAGPTLAQFTINGFSSLDFFNPTVTDGFNVPITITPGSSCTTAAVACTDASGDGNECGDTSSCPTGTIYTVSFC